MRRHRALMLPVELRIPVARGKGPYAPVVLIRRRRDAAVDALMVGVAFLPLEHHATPAGDGSCSAENPAKYEHELRARTTDYGLRPRTSSTTFEDVVRARTSLFYSRPSLVKQRKNKTPHLQLAQAGRVIRSVIRDCGHTLGSASSIRGSCTGASRRLPIVGAAALHFDIGRKARRRAHVAHDGAKWRAPTPDVPARAGLSWAMESRRREGHHVVEVILSDVRKDAR